MKASFNEAVGGFPQIRIEATAGEFMEVLNGMVDYDDGQNRYYDILDEELQND